MAIVSDNIVLRVDHLTKEFPGVKALDDISMEFREGEVHCLVGENGAGKSTLIKAITGYHAPTSGTITVHGKEYNEMSVRLAAENGIQVIYQEFNNVPPLTAAENVFLGVRTNKGPFVNYEKRRRAAKALFNRLGVDIDPNQPVESMSPAQKQIVEIAKSVSKNAKILIMDEPTAPLTVEEVHLLFQIIHDLKKQGVTIIYISHRLEELFEIGDRITVMRDGQYITTMNVEEATQQKLIAAMVGRTINQTCPSRQVEPGEEVLRVENLCGNGDVNINFTLHKGEILGFGGLVGAGRTELMEVLFGAAPLESGQIYLKGKPVRINTPRKGIRAGIGLVPEDRKGKGLFLDKSVSWNSTINCLDRFAHGIFGLVHAKEVEAEAKKLQKMFQIKAASLSQLVMNLSGGNQQKVVLAKTMAADAQIILFDEPTRGIDVGAKQEIYHLMNDLVSQGKAILMVSSDMPELLGMCDRIVVISEGRQIDILEKSSFDQERILTLASISTMKKAESIKGKQQI